MRDLCRFKPSTRGALSDEPRGRAAAAQAEHMRLQPGSAREGLQGAGAGKCCATSKPLGSCLNNMYSQKVSSRESFYFIGIIRVWTFFFASFPSFELSRGF